MVRVDKRVYIQWLCCNMFLYRHVNFSDFVKYMNMLHHIKPVWKSSLATSFLTPCTLQCFSSSRYAGSFTILGVIALLAAYMQVAFWTLAAGRQVKRIRSLFFHSIMQQEIGWFDVTETQELNTRLTECVSERSHTEVCVLHFSSSVHLSCRWWPAVFM